MKRHSGILMHISSLWGNYSIGGFSENAKKFIDFLTDAGFSYWQTLPFCMTDECNSPYKSFSSFSINPFFIDLNTLYKKSLLTEDELNSAKQSSPHLCEFERLKKERLNLLSLASKRCDANIWKDFYSTHPHTAKFCDFMAIKKTNNGAEWQSFADMTPDADALRLWQFCQFEAYAQWMEIKEYANSRGVKIIGDVPIYVALDSSDVWESPEEFLLDRRHMPTEVAGVPPDYFSEDGQLWGNPLYNWSAMKKNSYKWWKERMAFMCELFDGVRIDHFRGLESYFAIPASHTNAKNGKWKKGPGMSLIKELKNVTKDSLIIAEDLGIITEKVIKLVRDSGFPGMRVLQFGLLDSNSPHLPHNYENNCVAYTGTHDNNTMLGYIWELNGSDKQRLLNYIGHNSNDLDTCYDNIIRTMLASHAGLVIFPIQDLLKYGSDTRLNTPGKSENNWAFRITEEQLAEIDRAQLKCYNNMYGR